MACNLNLHTFPHDVQICTVMLKSCKQRFFNNIINKPSNHPRPVDLRELTSDLSFEQRKLFPDRGEDDLG